jgi:hypothetical protein
LPFIKENVIFGFVADKRAKIFTNNAVPIGSIFLIELFLDVLGH